MARPYEETTTIHAAALALEDESAAFVLLHYITAFNLPARVVAAAAGMSHQSLYLYAEAGEGVRPTKRIEPAMQAVVDKLKALEAEGKLALRGSSRDRATQLTSLLAIEAPAQ